SNAQSSDIRRNKDGTIVEYAILGKAADYERLAHGSLSHSQSQTSSAKSPTRNSAPNTQKTQVEERTAVEPGAPLAIDPAHDALALLPLIYWPISERQEPLSSAATARLNAYMRNGGMILIDTRDQWASGFSARGPGLDLSRRLTDGLAIPDLAAVDGDHVLTRSFYLLSGLPGRFRGGRVWVGADRATVSPVVVGRHDWAAAWARDAAGQPLFAVEPGGELQREMAFRFGVNLVMYALTGNYKADQVHVPAILERLGQ
ncbi:MAG: DUF4159 domain-containing protein, partial [Thalassobaculaceae bacterium]